MNDTWLICTNDAADVPADRYVVGVEVPRTSAVWPLCDAVLDPQHGGTSGVPADPPADCMAACDAALWLVRNQGPSFPMGSVYVTPRLDPDALVAAMILSGRLPIEVFDYEHAWHALDALAFADCSRPRDGGWMPEIKSHSVGDSPTWGPLAAMCAARDPLAVLEQSVRVVLGLSADPPADLVAARQVYERDMSLVGDLRNRFQVEGMVAVGDNLPFNAAVWAVGYSLAPVVVLFSELGGRRKFTVGACRDLGDAGARLIESFKKVIAAFEPGWGGAQTICGSPFAGTELDLDVVVDLMRVLAVHHLGRTNGPTKTLT